MSSLQRVTGTVLIASRALVAVALGVDAGLRAAAAAAAHAWQVDRPLLPVPPAEPSAVLLIDVDNLGIRRARLPRVLADLRRIAGGAPALAAGHPSVVTDEVRQLCAQLGIEVLATDTQPNAADRALLSAAMRLHASGVATWFIASADRAFAALPGTIVVLQTGAGRPAQDLVRRATEIRRVI